MCGIFATNDRNILDQLPATLANRLAFRGPDWQSGIVEHKGWLLYHARLSIIAPTGDFAQPYFTDSGGVLVFNGEILNFESLAARHRLHDRGSDTDVLAQLLGLPNFDLNELEGFFAFVYISSDGRMEHCVRDRFGVKPLSYFRQGDKVTISSEASVLSDLYGLDYNPQAIAEYRVFRAPIFAGSYFMGVSDVEPGTCLVNGRYFDTVDHVAKSYIGLADCYDALVETLEMSIRSRLIADVPVGLLLSGGIDSNLIRAYSDLHFQCLTGGFDGDYDVEFARDVKDHDVEVVPVTYEAFRSRLADMVKLRKEPLSVPNEVILSYLAEAWQIRGGRVLLSGEAADEFFGGYDRIFRWAAYAESFSIEQFLRLYAYSTPSDITADTRAQFNLFFDDLPPLSPFEIVRQFFLKKHLPVLFRRLDFALMYSGIEGREPFASTAMFKFAMQLEPRELFHNSLGKAPLRRLAERKLGTSFAYAPKVGFPIDLGVILGHGETNDRMDNYDLWYRENMRLIS